MGMIKAKIYNCWLCDQWIRDKKFMDHLRDHDTQDHWMAFNPSISFPKSLDECEKRFVPVGLLHLKEILVNEDEEHMQELKVLYG